MIEFQDGKCVFSHCAAALVQRDGFVLLQKSRGRFTIPGARVELLEQSAQAVERRLWEMTYVPVTADRLLWVVERFFDHEGCHVHQTVFIFQASFARIVPYRRLRRHHLVWWPVGFTKRIPLYPDFLRGKLADPPEGVEHLCLQ